MHSVPAVSRGRVYACMREVDPFGERALEDGVEAREQRGHETHSAKRPREPAEEGEEGRAAWRRGEVLQIGADPRRDRLEAELDAGEQSTELRARKRKM